MIAYFDSAASYPLLPEVAAALSSANESMIANPSSQHTLGEDANNAVERCRSALADSIGAAPSEIIFTSGATESNNLALKGHFSLPSAQASRHLVISSIEHKCVHAIADYLNRTSGVSISLVQPNKAGIITTAAIESALQPHTELVSIMHVNNELGTLNPIADIGALCFERGIKFHTDAAQSFLKTGIDVDDMNIDYASFSAHKIGGPKGIGALFIRDQRKQHMEPVVHGAGQEAGLRGGTVAAPLIQGFTAAISHFPKAYQSLKARGLKDLLLENLQKERIDHIVNGDGLPSILSLTLPNTDVQALLLNSGGTFALATGSACSSKEIEVSHVLAAIGLDRMRAEHTLRLSFYHRNDVHECDSLAKLITKYSNTSLIS